MRKFLYLCILSLFVFSTLFLFARPVNDAQENFDKMIILADKLDAEIQVLSANLELLQEYYDSFGKATDAPAISPKETGVKIDRTIELLNKMDDFKKLNDKIRQLGW